MEFGSKVQYRPKTVIIQQLFSEAAGAPQRWVVQELDEGNIVRSEVYDTLSEAERARDQWKQG